MAQRGFPEILSFGDVGYGDELLRGAWMTLQIAFCAYVIGVSIGLAGAMGKLGGSTATRTILNLYTTLVRASPELILILLLYYAGTGLLNFAAGRLRLFGSSREWLRRCGCGLSFRGGRLCDRNITRCGASDSRRSN